MHLFTKINTYYLQYFTIFKYRYLSSDTNKRIANGALWGLVGSVAPRTVTIALSFILARILGKEGFGEFGIILSTVGMISGFAGLGLGSTVTRYIANLKTREPLRAGRIIGLSSIITAITALIYGVIFIYFAPFLAEKTLAAPQLTLMLQISSIAIGLGVVNSVQMAILNGLESFKTASILSTIFGIAQSVLTVCFAYYLGVKGAVIAFSLSSIITVIVYYFVSRKELKATEITITYKDVWQESNVLIKYSLPAFLGTITVGPVMWATNALLANQPNGYGELGLYNAAMQWHLFVHFLPALVATAVLPIMSELYGKGNKTESYIVMKKMMGLTSYLVIPLAIIISLISPIIIKAYGESFNGGHWVIIIVVATTVLYSISVHLGTFIAASGKMWTGFYINIIWGITFLLTSYFLVRYGAVGLAIAKFIAYFFHFIWSWLICLKLQKRFEMEQKLMQ